MDESHFAVCDAAQLVDYGILPVAGGWLDQSAQMVEAILVVQGERAAYQEAEAEKARRDAERQAKRKRG